MEYSTKLTYLEKIANLVKLNSRFHKYQEDKIDQNNSIFISSVEATLVHHGKINKDGNLISKFNREINLQRTLGEQANLFSGGFYMNFYLSPKDKHYWRIPYDGKVISTKICNGKSKIPIITGLEKFFPNIDFFEKSIKKNATIGTVFQTKDFPYAMIAVGSLNVNSIHTIKQDYFKKGEVGGYFSMGSSMILCFPPTEKIKPLINLQTKVDIGERIIQLSSKPSHH